jgi:hypothetical protein
VGGGTSVGVAGTDCVRVCVKVGTGGVSSSGLRRRDLRGAAVDALVSSAGAARFLRSVVCFPFDPPIPRSANPPRISSRSGCRSILLHAIFQSRVWLYDRPGGAVVFGVTTFPVNVFAIISAIVIYLTSIVSPSALDGSAVGGAAGPSALAAGSLVAVELAIIGAEGGVVGAFFAGALFAAALFAGTFFAAGFLATSAFLLPLFLFFFAGASESSESSLESDEDELESSESSRSRHSGRLRQRPSYISLPPGYRAGPPPQCPAVLGQYKSNP